MKKKMQQIYQLLKKHSLLFKLIFFGSILIFVSSQVANIAHGMSWHDILETMKQQDRIKLLLMAFTGLIGVLPMLLYDWVTLRVLEHQGKPEMPRKEWFVAAWTTNTINNLAGFGGVIGASLRAKFYGSGTDRKKVLATVSKVALFMLSGLSIWAFITFIDSLFLHKESIFLSYWFWLLGGSLVTPGLLLLVYLKRKTLFKEFIPRGIIGLLTASFGQWTGALFVFLVIGHLMSAPIQMVEIYPMFIIATLIGMLTMIPGGMGTFDVLMILGMSQLGVGQDMAVVWLLYYRLFYYLVPFLSGIFLFVTQAGVKVNRFFDNLPRLFSQKIAHTIVVGAVYFAGIMMVLLSTITNLSAISKIFQFLLPFSFNFLDQTLNLLVGFLLLGLARGLSMKVKKAFWPTIILLSFGIVNTIQRTTSLRLIVVYVLIVLAVWVARNEFYREKFVYSWEAIAVDGVLFGFLFIVYAIAGYFSSSGRMLSGNLIPNKFLLFPSDDIWFSGLIGLGVSLLALVTLYQYLATTNETLGEEWNEARFHALLKKYGGTNASHYLELPGYTYFYYQEDGSDQVAFGYQMKGNKCFILGNPIGNQEKWKKATLAFMIKADRLGYQLAFYKISEQYIVALHDLGFHFVKVGESGVVDLQKENLPSFTEAIELKRLSNEGYHFTFYPELPSEVYKELESVSKEWLGGQTEKYFSVGRFEEAYLSKSGVGVVRNPTNQLVGFITQQPINEKCSSYDLLRVSANQPGQLPNFLIAHLMEYSRQQGEKEVDLGMAPLVHVGDTQFSFFEEKVMHIIYNYGTSFYAFQDNYEAKSKYVDAWEGRYFAYMKNSRFTLTAGQLLLLIGRGKTKGATVAEEAMIEL
ncbi:phosphatidylglycerol lysyltransferase [Enterococcus phoeniculicola]|uniref:Phosphatidylglycerol lysyltransferase n=1 Tax=Enterococcus phoeniculicola ATCC BAA-412 TaxID=1158610 RepID=R3U6Q0_9ENTE|nr:phosphatidylglycerol lysyltransferase [Enterococcus phoeniculicola ATCC BAA-412]EOT70931.1 phosphatidylglycerol lysyltransferase [Enterococcus phoeniculicola ATCC BAA-412]OJG70506.1 phosphatidylglycerol lysyltransferase [Enterococcus phoeniculicola]